MNLLDVSGLQVFFEVGGQILPVVDRIELTLSHGESFVIVGESGSGKSAFAMSLLGILPQNARIRGTILFQGKNLLELDRKSMRAVRGIGIGYVPQSSSTSLNPVLRIGTQFHHVLQHSVKGEESSSAVTRILQDLGLDESVAHMYPHQLSEGIKGRLLVGLGTCLDPMLIIADEPTKGLDSHTKEGILRIFEHRVTQQGRSLIMITHDLDVAAWLPGRLGIMYAGEIVEWGPATVVLADGPCHPYTLGLLKSLPQREFIPLPGRCVGLLERHTGCRFANRCSRVEAVCKRQHPELCRVCEGHWVRCFHA
ncbi:MAG: ABC transporter ATP-binding protein [Deltaproteobacteria bacterium]|nr:ABC transporter ATP-binding protein [Deltaproteobacteria bacterium]